MASGETIYQIRLKDGAEELRRVQLAVYVNPERCPRTDEKKDKKKKQKKNKKRYDSDSSDSDSDSDHSDSDSCSGSDTD